MSDLNKEAQPFEPYAFPAESLHSHNAAVLLWTLEDARTHALEEFVEMSERTDFQELANEMFAEDDDPLMACYDWTCQDRIITALGQKAGIAPTDDERIAIARYYKQPDDTDWRELYAAIAEFDEWQLTLRSAATEEGASIAGIQQRFAQIDEAVEVIGAQAVASAILEHREINVSLLLDAHSQLNDVQKPRRTTHD